MRDKRGWIAAIYACPYALALGYLPSSVKGGNEDELTELYLLHDDRGIKTGSKQTAVHHPGAANRIKLEMAPSLMRGSCADVAELPR